MSASLFARTTRYVASQWLNPRENRLTEVSAAVLERVDGLAINLVRSMLMESLGKLEQDRDQGTRFIDELSRQESLLRDIEALRHGRISVDTQVATSSGKFIDLEIHIRPELGSDLDDVLIWVEIKHGTQPGHRQLENYVEDIEFRAASRRVVMFLTSERELPEVGVVPVEVPAATWEHFASDLPEFALGRTDSTEQWLLSEYMAYLKEERLMRPEGLTTVHALALSEIRHAEGAIAEVCERADVYVRTHWNDRGSHRTRSHRSDEAHYGPGWWSLYPTHKLGDNFQEGSWAGDDFEWAIFSVDDTDLQETRGAWLIIAGASTSAGKSRVTRRDGNGEWLTGCLALGFQDFGISGRYRLMRVKYPDELLNQNGVEAQGEELGRWIVASFNALANNPPPN